MISNFSKESQLQRPKRPSIKSLDRILSKVVRTLAFDDVLGYSPCWICNKEGSQAAHIFSKKAYPKSRYDFINNIRWTCFICHKGGKHSMHEDPEAFRGWFDNKFGIGSMDKLKEIVTINEATSQKLDPLMVKFLLQSILNNNDFMKAQRDLIKNWGGQKWERS